jgi:glycosyltransferase involved in cell wall biosynthesis
MSLCLSMIVKNEAHIIQRCLRSVKPLIDSYSISDTGSTDNTMELIRQELAGIPGVLARDPWQDFGTNRNISLSRCKGDHILFIDADEVLNHHGGPLNLDSRYDTFWIKLIYPEIHQFSRKIIRNDSRWHWIYKIHEELSFDGEPRNGKIENFTITAVNDSDQNIRGNKGLHHLEILAKEPPTPRNVFYQAQTLMSLRRFDEALLKYNERIAMGGPAEEVYYSLYRAGDMMRVLGRPFDETASALFRAYIFRPSRFEALLLLCLLLRQNNLWEQIYSLTSIEPKVSNDITFVDRNAHWHILEEHAVASIYLGKYAEALKCFRRVAEFEIPNDARERTEKNISLLESRHSIGT